jgi:transcriptional regulator GlxA family with amidase domain
MLARDALVGPVRRRQDARISHPEAIRRVQDAVSREPAAAWSATRLARLACTSSRNLTRLFAQHARCSPLDYVQRMRFALARELVTQSALRSRDAPGQAPH